MKRNIEKQLQSLEAKAKPRMISTLADLVKWCADHGDIEVELSREIQALVDESLRWVEEEATGL